MSQSGIYLSVIVPAYNEAEQIAKTLERIDRFLRSREFGYEIIAVLDGPTDGTREVVNHLSGGIANLHVIDRSVNRGKGYTVREGMLKASGSVRLFSDADNSTDIAHFEKMKPLLDGGCDVVIASRSPKDASGAEQSAPQPWHKRKVGQLGNGLVQLLALRGIADTQCGFKAFRAEAAQRIFARATVDGWGFDIEVLALARALNYRIGIIPAHWINDPHSAVRAFDYLRVLGDALKVRFNLLSGKYNL